MAFEIDVYVSFAHLDNIPMAPADQGWVSRFTRALEARLSQVLGRKAVVHLDVGLRGHDTFADTSRDLLERAAAFVAIVSPRYVRSEWTRREVEMFTQAHADAGLSAERGRLFPVLTHDVPPEEQPRPLQDLLGYRFFSVDHATGETRQLDRIFGADADRDFLLRLDDLVHDIAGTLKPLEPLDEPRPDPSRPIAREMYQIRDPRERDRVQLGISAPYEVRRGGVFMARFAAYIESLANDVEKRLRELDARTAGGSHAVLGLSPDRIRGWHVGAPVTVRASGAHMRVQPSTRSFEWNGRQNLVSFLVTVDADAPAGDVALCFEAFIEGVSVSFIPLTVTIGASDGTSERGVVMDDIARTAFASYASGDAPLVASCLSALQRWDPDLNVFMDCLDLTPNGEWQDQLRRVIPRHDAFLLFWSANASRSQWVAWELQHAKESKGLGWIRPMPLDDPAIVPPPEDLAHLHFGDRYLLARQAFLRRASATR